MGGEKNAKKIGGGEKKETYCCSERPYKNKGTAEYTTSTHSVHALVVPRDTQYCRAVQKSAQSATLRQSYHGTRRVQRVHTVHMYTQSTHRAPYIILFVHRVNPWYAVFCCACVCTAATAIAQQLHKRVRGIAARLTGLGAR